MPTELPETSATPIRTRMIERSPGYFGWWILAAATLGMMMTSPGQTYGVSVFPDHIIAELVPVLYGCFW